MNHDLLKKLWADGLPAAAIADRLGTSTASVTAARRRLALPTRGSPVESKVTTDKLAERVADGQEPRKAGRAIGLTDVQADRVWRRIVASLGAQAV